MPSNDDYVTSEGRRLLRDGSRALGAVLTKLQIEGPSAAVEAELRSTFPVLRSAMNWLEDTDDFETAHERLDTAGSTARSTFRSGCAFVFRDGQYHQECPV